MIFDDPAAIQQSRPANATNIADAYRDPLQFEDISDFTKDRSNPQDFFQLTSAGLAQPRKSDFPGLLMKTLGKIQIS